jgi:hypothetical protein
LTGQGESLFQSSGSFGKGTAPDQAPNPATGCHEPPGNLAPDQAGRAGDEDTAFHVATSLPKEVKNVISGFPRIIGVLCFGA